MFPHRSKSRTANVLIATLIVLVGVGAMMALMSDRLVGTRQIQSVNLARQQATAAAEAAASLIETKLVQASGDLKTLTEDVTLKDSKGNPIGVGPRWLQDGFFNSDTLKSPSALWMGNCLVYWRVEPVKIYDTTIEDKNGDGLIDVKDGIDANSKYSNNFQANPNTLIQPTKTWSGTAKDSLNPGYYHFRILTQAFYINRAEWEKNKLTLLTANPWTKPEQKITIASSQTQRMVQLKLINLFRYVIFYGATGATGDIELNPGADLDIVGAVHTNGALYLGGQGSAYLKTPVGDYHDSASSNSHIYIGSKDNLATITGVDGIYRTRKVGNYHYEANVHKSLTSSWQDPSLILPVTDSLSGNDAGSDRVLLNGDKFTFENDSRSTPPLKDHTDYVRDRSKGATLVNTLANIPQLSGYPFESQVVVGQGQLLYRVGAAGPFTIRPNDFPAGTAQQLYYNAANGMTTVPGANPKPIYATDLLLVTVNRSGKLVNDVMPNQPTSIVTAANPAPAVDPTAANLQHNLLANQADTFLLHPDIQIETENPALPGYEARGYYLQNALFGKTGSGLTGLTIRERGAQNLVWPMLTGDKVAAGVPITVVAARPDPADYATEGSWLKAFAGYMARNYVVYFGVEGGSPVDITAPFFGFTVVGVTLTPTYTDRLKFPAWETGFMNRREASAYRRMGYFLNDISAAKYQVDVLTLNIARILEIIRVSKWVDLCPITLRDVSVSALFNGMIYAHRTPRLGKTVDGTDIFDPSMPLTYHPLATPVQFSAKDLYKFEGGRYPILGSVTRGNVNAGNNNPDRNGDPVWNVWSVFPSPKQVRVINGAEINWGGKQPSGRRQGLTVVTPNHCYIQGNYNKIPDPQKTADGNDQYPPCGVYADGLTMLTNLWNDANAAYDKTPYGDTTTYNVSMVLNNIPTDNENMWDEGSGGTHNLLRFLEGGNREFQFLGSIVVLNRMRYGRNYLGASAGFYGAPKRVLKFNSDLLTAEGQPPFSPWGVQVTRVLSSVNLTNR